MRFGGRCMSHVQRNMTMLVGAIAVIVIALGGPLGLTLGAFNATTKVLSDKLLPIELTIGGVSDALAASFAWHGRLNAAVNLQEFEAVKLERPAANGLDGRLASLRETVRSVDSSHVNEVLVRLGQLETGVRHFVGQEEQLLASHGKRHGLQQQFEQAVAGLDRDLRAHLLSMDSLQGQIRLDFMAQLAELDSTSRGGKFSAVAREVVEGADRAAYDVLQDLRTSTILMGMQLGRIGLCNDIDTLRSIVANEVGPTVGTVNRRLADLLELVQADAARYEQVQRVQEKFQDLVARSTGPEPTSLRGLRQAILEEIQRAATTRAKFQDTALELGTGVVGVQQAVDGMVNELKEHANNSIVRSQWVAVVGGLLALVGVAVALGRIAGSVRELRRTNEELLLLRDSLRQANAGLEMKVQERTEALAEREVAVRRLLNGLAEGVVEVSMDGRLSEERSRVVEEWFGVPEPGARAMEYLFSTDAHAQVAFEMGLEQLVDGFLPVELCIEQLPTRLRLESRTLQLNYRPVLDGEATKGLLVIIEDITSRLVAERAQRQAHEFQRLAQHVLQDHDGFMRFVNDASELLQRVGDARSGEEAKMPLHTLKGNCAVFGAQEMADLCHGLEDQLEEARSEGVPRPPTKEEVQRLELAWEQMLSRMAVFCRPSSDSVVSIPREELERILEELRAFDPELALQVERCMLAPVRDELSRIGQHVGRLAERLNKVVDVEIECHKLRADLRFAQPLLGELIHVVRNALDHGIETPEVRKAAGKQERAVLRLASEISHDGKTLAFEVSDDGRGIDWDKIRAKAREQGLPNGTQKDLVNALFASGVSTADVVSDISGRGVGMSAVRAACVSLGGNVEVHSVAGKGTRFLFKIPTPHGVKVLRDVAAEPASRVPSLSPVARRG